MIACSGSKPVRDAKLQQFFDICKDFMQKVKFIYSFCRKDLLFISIVYCSNPALYVHSVGMSFRHPISVHSAGILFRHDHCPFGRTLFDIFLCPFRRNAIPTSHLRPFPAILCGFVLCCSCYLPFIASMRRIFMCGIYFFHFRAPKFAYIKNFSYLCTRIRKYPAPVLNRFAPNFQKTS